ncbi:TonB-dependent receptor [Maribacter sp. ANRC-HE7]|uniref:TonB-dependent receptor n=1 Tax=Maribacter aquimaris TaxID=2737171 RepID=A0ABR7UZP0_9FLAO|nr:TonB-dependent receptor [Maribacter aquimaris]MBD0778062.1 TonB-dependent receptor [Maribacter aquimaris]
MLKHLYLLIAILGISQLVQAQEEEDSIGTETVTVTKAYSPTISDAFKLKSIPNLNDSIVLQKKQIEYNIFSVPVASTFTPAKGKASAVKKLPPPELYNSYASAGLGNPGNLMAKFYTSRAINRDERLDLGFDHYSSLADIDGVALDSKYANTEIDASYSKRDRDINWGADVGLQHQLYNWYGLPEETYDAETINGIDAKQNYFMGEVGAYVNVEDAYFKNANIQYRRFWDAVESGENRVVLGAGLELPVGDESLGVNVKLDYVGGSFANADVNSPTNDQGIDYSNFQVGINPTLRILRDDLTVDLGMNLVYGMDMEESESNFYIYPAIAASYRLLDENVIAYGGVKGELRQNSYYGFVEENPYVSPTLAIQPTDTQYDAYVGFKGQLLPNLSYNVKGSYTAENRRPLFHLNPQNGFRDDEKEYYYGNSFQVFYDDIKTLGLFAELNVDVNRNFTLGVNAEVYDYDTETDNPAWNLPDIKGSLFMDYQIDEKWYMGVNLFYVGERDDFSATVVENPTPGIANATLITLDGYFDANAHVGYRLNDQLSFFVKGANLSNNDYRKWANFPVQGFQILGGATYKFDF